MPEKVRYTTRFPFITDGIAVAVGKREVVIMGGAEVIDQALIAGLVNRPRIHLSPVVMDAGTRLFDLVDGPLTLRRADVVATPTPRT